MSENGAGHLYFPEIWVVFWAIKPNWSVCGWLSQAISCVNSSSREPLVTALPEHYDPTQLANEFGIFFLQKKWNHKGKSWQVSSSRASTCSCHPNGEPGEFFYAIHRGSVSDCSRILLCPLLVGSWPYVASEVLSWCISALYHWDG